MSQLSVNFKSLAKQIPCYKKTILAALTLGVLSTLPMKANSALINCTNSFGTDNATFSCLNNTGLPSNGIEIDLTSLYGNNNSDYSISIDNNNWLETGDNSDGLYTFNPEFSAFNWENADNLLGLITFDTTSQSSRFYG